MRTVQFNENADTFSARNCLQSSLACRKTIDIKHPRIASRAAKSIKSLLPKPLDEICKKIKARRLKTFLTGCAGRVRLQGKTNAHLYATWGAFQSHAISAAGNPDARDKKDTQIFKIVRNFPENDSKLTGNVVWVKMPLMSPRILPNFQFSWDFCLAHQQFWLVMSMSDELFLNGARTTRSVYQQSGTGEKHVLFYATSPNPSVASDERKNWVHDGTSTNIVSTRIAWNINLHSKKVAGSRLLYPRYCTSFSLHVSVPCGISLFNLNC